MARWSFEPILESYLAVVLLAALLLALLLLIRPLSNQLTRRRRLTLLLLRAGLILLLVLAMLRPTRVSTQSRPQSATLLLLYDQSRSMQVEDAAGGASRWTALRECLQASQASLRQLAQVLELRVYGFADQLQPGDVQAGTLRLPPRPRGRRRIWAQPWMMRCDGKSANGWPR